MQLLRAGAFNSSELSLSGGVTTGCTSNEVRGYGLHGTLNGHELLGGHSWNALCIIQSNDAASIIVLVDGGECSSHESVGVRGAEGFFKAGDFGFYIGFFAAGAKGRNQQEEMN